MRLLDLWHRLSGKSLIVWYAVFLHLTWALSCFEDKSVLGVTAISAIPTWIPVEAFIPSLVGVALLAVLGLVRSPGRLAACLMLPQQFIMFLCAGGAVVAMYLAQFADGVQRSHWFLISDQAPALLAALAHMGAVLRVWRGSQ